jgi:hypothetical protein
MSASAFSTIEPIGLGSIVIFVYDGCGPPPPLGAVTTPVAAEVACPDPPLFEAVTVTFKERPSSAVVSAYVAPMAPPIGAQVVPWQRSHWYPYAVGVFVQVPWDEVSVWPTTVEPLMLGGVWFTGAPTVVDVWNWT